jgi:hypothetical protein
VSARLACALALLVALPAQAGRHHRRRHTPPRHAPRVAPAEERPREEARPRADDDEAREVVAPAAVAAVSTPVGAVSAAAADGPPPGSLELCTLALDGGVGARDLAFGPGALPGQRSHGAPVVALIGFRVELHPFARSPRRFLAGLGATAGFLHSVGARSALEDGAEVDNRWLSFDVGLHERVRLGRHAVSPWVGLGLSYGQLSFAFERDGRLAGDLPSVNYRFVRTSLDLRFPFGPVHLALAGGYRAVVQAGYLAERFGDEVKHAFDASASLAVRLPRGFALGVRGEYTHVSYPNAVDRFASGTLLVAWIPR